MPASVLANAALSTPGSLTSGSGSVGQDLIQSANAMISVFSAWQSLQADATAIGASMQQAQAAIAQANTAANQGAVNIDIQQLQGLKSVATDTVNIVTGITGMVSGFVQAATGDVAALAGVLNGAGSTAQAAVSLSYDNQILSQIGQLQSLNSQSEQDAVASAVAQLNSQVISSAAAMSSELDTLRQDINNLSAGNAALTTDRNTASYYAGKASGADVWNCGSSQAPEECVSHVNTVLNRRYDGTQIRYDTALKNAKALAYEARLSIEQRLGIRLSDITTPIGTLNPPSTWADDVCHVTGINFKELADQLPDAGASMAQQTALDQQIASNFADQFVGDYVQELTDFVSFFNTTYPEQDGNDTAVLSLRETLLGGGSACKQASPNLLSDSSRLYALVAPSTNTTLEGWERNACAATDANCLTATSLGGLPLPSVPGGATWLHDTPRPALQNGVDPVNVDAVQGGPDNVESQQVTLSNPGTYVLSWWDVNIAPGSGLPATTAAAGTQTAYQVGVYDSAWSPLGGYTAVPPLADSTTVAATGGWGPRRSITFTLTAPDVVHVAFGASAGSGQGSVGVANVQLELAGSAGTPTAYADTDGAGQTTSYDCPLSPAAMQALFTRNCDSDGTCHYDLNTPIAINTQTMTANGMSLAGKLATGNFNFRHIDVALNVVGTGVIDCTSTGSPDCFGSGFLQYTLADDGTNVGVLGFDKQYRMFDFGTATIDHAKALTAERYLTLPLGSSDQALVTQFQQTQFRGRPIDGVYSLRIYDTPALHFSQIQDVQLVLSYHYWSRVITSKSSN